MNQFYKLPIFSQWIGSIILIILGFIPVLVLIEHASKNPLYYLLFFIYSPIAQFSVTPLFKLLGIYRYYSPMLLGYMPNNSHIDLHAGTSFDYLFVMNKYKIGNQLKNQLLQYYFEGLVKIIELIENKDIPDTIKISGTSYFFNNSSISLFGFYTESPSLFHRLNIYFNFIDLLWMYSLSKGKISIPKLQNINKACIDGATLVAHKETILSFYTKLKTIGLKEF